MGKKTMKTLKKEIEEIITHHDLACAIK